MKSEIEKLLEPGELSIEGFIGTDTRSIDDIITADADSISNLDLTPEKIAQRLEELQSKGRDIMEREQSVEDRYRITVRDDRGPMPNPSGDKPLRKGDTTIVDSKSGKTITFNALTISMLRDYTFCSGAGSCYRLDPADLKEVLY